MATRKTIALADLITEINERNARSTCHAECRNGWNSVLETVLMDANAYHGFGYLDASQLTERAAGSPPGIVWGFNPTTGERDNKFNQYPDESRKIYYAHPKLRITPKSIKTTATVDA